MNMKVKVNWGRNKGLFGKVVREDKDFVYVDFGRDILVNEGFGSLSNYRDAYWVAKKYVIMNTPVEG